MATKIIVSYDGTDNDRDALALGRLLAGAGASLELAYVRHAHEAESGRERLAEQEAGALLEAGAGVLGQPDVPRHVVLSGSTPAGLRDLALAEGADVIVFGSGVPDGAGPRRSAGLGAAAARRRARRARARSRGLRRAQRTSPSGRSRRSARTATRARSRRRRRSRPRSARRSPSGAGGDVDLVVVGSKPGTVTGRVTISAAAEYLIELSRCPVVVLPRGVAVRFGS